MEGGGWRDGGGGGGGGRGAGGVIRNKQGAAVSMLHHVCLPASLFHPLAQLPLFPTSTSS